MGRFLDNQIGRVCRSYQSLKTINRRRLASEVLELDSGLATLNVGAVEAWSPCAQPLGSADAGR